MAVSSETAQSLIEELFLMGRAFRSTLAQPEEGQLLPGALGVLVALETIGPCRQVDLANRMCISPSALSRHITELVTAGYMSRHADPTDGRATLVEISDNGRELLHRVRISRARSMRKVLADWTEEEADQVCTLVHKLRNSLLVHAQRSAVTEQQ